MTLICGTALLSSCETVYGYDRSSVLVSFQEPTREPNAAEDDDDDAPLLTG